MLYFILREMRRQQKVEEYPKQAGAELCQAQLRFEVWGLVKALCLIFENHNVEEVWSQSSLKLKKLLDEKVWSFRWWSLKLKKF